MKKNTGLGRGLDHLFSRDETQISAEEKNAMISAMLESMSQNDKTKFKEILSFMENSNML